VNYILSRGGDDDQLAAEISTLRGSLSEYVRILLREDIEIMNENIVNNAIQWAKEKGTTGIKKLKKFIQDFKSELEETGTGSMILQKIVAGESMSPGEIAFLKAQTKDVAVGGFLLGLFILPGGGFATVGLVKLAKKFNIDLMPSSFNRGESDSDETIGR
jgi:hypothetical protein